MKSTRFFAAAVCALSMLSVRCTESNPAATNTDDTQAPFAVAKSASVERATGDVADALIAEQATSINTFAAQMYAQLAAEQEGNIFFSPYSIVSALGMTAAGAEAETDRQIREALSVTLQGDDFHAALNGIDQSLEQHSTSTEKLTMTVANDAWVQSGWEFRVDYLDLLSRYYGAGVNLLDFISRPDESRVVINTYIADQTNQKITNLLPQGSITTLTRLVLTNAVYFLADWVYQFDKSLTTDEPFRLLDGSRVTVPMMKLEPEGNGSQVELQYAWDPEHKVRTLQLPYSGDRMAMTLFLPDTNAFEDFEEALSHELLQSMISRLSDTKLPPVRLPRFTFTSPAISLKKAFRALGMSDAFDPNKADFSGIDGERDLYVFDILHKAFIAVDEAGTEAAAATAVIIGTTSVPTHIPRFVADRPFVYCIRDTQTGVILFMGKVEDPREEG